VNKKHWLRRSGIRMGILGLMFVPLMMGADCNNGDGLSGNDIVNIVGIAVDAILAIIFAFA